MLNGQGNTRKQTAKLRKEMVDRSFDAEEEAALLALLLNDSKNQEKALATLMRYYTGLPLNQLCALTCGDCIVDPELPPPFPNVLETLCLRTFDFLIEYTSKNPIR